VTFLIENSVAYAREFDFVKRMSTLNAKVSMSFFLVRSMRSGSLTAFARNFDIETLCIRVLWISLLPSASTWTGILYTFAPKYFDHFREGKI
jgi:hypothetical protein